MLRFKEMPLELLLLLLLNRNTTLDYVCSDARSLSLSLCH